MKKNFVTTGSPWGGLAGALFFVSAAGTMLPNGLVRVDVVKIAYNTLRQESVQSEAKGWSCRGGEVVVCVKYSVLGVLLSTPWRSFVGLRKSAPQGCAMLLSTRQEPGEVERVVGVLPAEHSYVREAIRLVQEMAGQSAPGGPRGESQGGAQERLQSADLAFDRQPLTTETIVPLRPTAEGDDNVVPEDQKIPQHLSPSSIPSDRRHNSIPSDRRRRRKRASRHQQPGTTRSRGVLRNSRARNSIARNSGPVKRRAGGG